MKKIFQLGFTVCLMMLLAASCTEEKPVLSLDGDTDIIALTLDSEYAGTIDKEACRVTVSVPSDYDVSEMTLTAIEVSENAETDISEGDKLNMNFHQTMRVVNGNVYEDWSLIAVKDKAELLSLTLGSKYKAVINGNSANVFVPAGTDITAMSVNYEVPEGTKVSVEKGAVLDFSNPVEITLTYNSAVQVYTVTVILHNMSMEPKAFVGNAAEIDLLGTEAKAAAQWAMNNIPNMKYICVQDVLSGVVKLEDFRMLWCHLDFTDWPSYMWDSRNLFNSFWAAGGSMLATRDGARYINDVWCIALNQKSPNVDGGGNVDTTLQEDRGISIKGYENHPLYEDLAVTPEGVVFLKSTGCNNTGRTMYWNVSQEPYTGLDSWKEATGATDLANDDSGNPDMITIAEFEPREMVGRMSGKVITIGSEYYEWHDKNGAENRYEDNLHQLTKNAINYLCK